MLLIVINHLNTCAYLRSTKSLQMWATLSFFRLYRSRSAGVVLSCHRTYPSNSVFSGVFVVMRSRSLRADIVQEEDQILQSVTLLYLTSCSTLIHKRVGRTLRTRDWQSLKRSASHNAVGACLLSHDDRETIADLKHP